jgi:histidyl-tRNA synthetase
MKDLNQNAPKLIEHLDEGSKKDFESLCRILDDAQIEYTINPQLVRGLDYYNKTVFEWISDELGAQGTVCGGGRYDGLAEQLGGHPTPAIGFSIGLERLVELVISQEKQTVNSQIDIYLVLMGDNAIKFGLIVAEKIRNHFPLLQVITHCGGGSMKSQLKQADKSGAKWAVIIGEDEVSQEKVTLKSLREHQEQVLLTTPELLEWFKRNPMQPLPEQLTELIQHLLTLSESMDKKQPESKVTHE